MSRHSFDPEIAMRVGVNAAVIYQNIVWWCEKNAANGVNVRNDLVWTYNSKKAFSLLFPYMSERQIRTALDKLEAVNLLVSDCFNKDPRDRTKWYSANDKSDTLHLTKKSNGTDLEVQPLPDSKPVINKPPNPQGGGDLFSDASSVPAPVRAEDPIEEGFKVFWGEIWPKHNRKFGESDCEKIYRRACLGTYKKSKGRISPQDINRAAERYIASTRGDYTFLKGTLAWLRSAGWEAFLDEGGAAYSESDLTQNQARALRRGECPPSMLVNGAPSHVARYWLKNFGFVVEE